jgi:hypothetical protein
MIHAKAQVLNPETAEVTYENMAKHFEVPVGLDEDALSDFIGIKVDDLVRGKHKQVDTKDDSFVTRYSAEVHNPEKLNLLDVKMKGVGLHYKILDKLNEGMHDYKAKPGMCVPQYLFKELQGLKGFYRDFTYKQLLCELNIVCDRDVSKGDGMSVNEIAEWLRKHHPMVSMYCFNPLMKLAFKQIREGKSLAILCFVINNGHLYPISNENLKKDISKTKKLRGQDFDFVAEDFCIDVRFDGTEFNFLDEDNYDDFLEGNTESKVLIIKDKELPIDLVLNELIRKTNRIDMPFMMDGQSKIKSFQHPITIRLSFKIPTLTSAGKSARSFITSSRSTSSSSVTRATH